MSKIIILSNDKNIFIEDIEFFYDVKIFGENEFDLKKIEKNEKFYLLIDEENWNKNILKELLDLELNFKFAIFSEVNVIRFARKYYKLGASCVYNGKIKDYNIVDIISELDERVYDRFGYKELEKRNIEIENELTDYQVLYEMTKILRLELAFEEVIEKLLYLLENLVSGFSLFVLKRNEKEKHYYLKDGKSERISFLKKLLKYSKSSMLIDILENSIAFIPNFLDSKSWYSFPIIIKNNLRGYLLLVKHSELELSEKEEQIIIDILSHAGIIIENAYLLEESKNMNFEIVKSLVKAIEAKDTYTKGHSQRVAEYSYMIAKELGFSPAKLKELDMAAVLHDVGKIGLPEYILNKTGKLTDYEFEQIKKHPENGYEIVSQINNMKNIAEIIRHHHEKWNGTGYPLGLKKKEIPLTSRIISVADTYDAITSDRPYRKGLSHEFAVQELKKNKNIQFEEKLVDVFLKLMEDREL
ncbi:HD-GYP domain-containing protein [Haliovirga abyssi]|uniref:HD-GYP domain-containing protein n=1 Tax=Haliovirga abyssi TaxID=2996794 RepID=A0AAU9DIT6_9FUSO|nr:HD-GYP domain-containing protein [Haliovirga abyssi]BDU50684.1 hypothetical protein HLVA_12530 [Haliovirga abyssi]